MPLVTVYFEGPNPDSGPSLSPWFQVVNPSSPTQTDLTERLTLHFADGQPCWRQEVGDLWLDRNHAYPGFGYLSIMAASYSGAHSSGPYCVIGDRPYDLRGGRFSCLVGSEALRLGKAVRILFWIQFFEASAADGQGRYVNLGYLARPVDQLLGFPQPPERRGQETRSTRLVPFEVTFDAGRSADWIAYGSSPKKSGVYALPTSLEAMFTSWGCNLGFHAVYGPDLPEPDDFPAGHFHIANIRLEVDDGLNGLAHPNDEHASLAHDIEAIRP